MKRRIITLCGSTRFKKEFEEAEKYLTLAGNIILTVGCFGYADKIPLTTADKIKLDCLHLAKIKMSDSIYVINKDGYIGESTAREIEYAKVLGLPIAYLEPLKEATHD